MNACVKCGYCCTVRCCSFGKWSRGKESCVYLSELNGLGQRECLVYELVSTTAHAPAFHAGCSSSLFNEVRRAVLEKILTRLRELGVKRGI